MKIIELQNVLIGAEQLYDFEQYLQSSISKMKYWGFIARSFDPKKVEPPKLRIRKENIAELFTEVDGLEVSYILPPTQWILADEIKK